MPTYQAALASLVLLCWSISLHVQVKSFRIVLFSQAGDEFISWPVYT